jgi:hypothetical protein
LVCDVAAREFIDLRADSRHDIAIILDICMHNEFPILSGGSGAAFLLESPAKVSLALNFPKGMVSIRQGAPFATVSLVRPLHQEEAVSEAWRVLQEALDVFAARGQATLQTAEGDCTYFVWVTSGASYELVFVDTIDAPWSVNMNMTMSAEGAGTVVSAPASAPSPPPRHPALRFYRLAHTSADLFDAFRNAYLALECLASEALPKTNKYEAEVDWLMRVLDGPLAPTLPSGWIERAMVNDICTHGRHPISHAKMGRGFYIPHGPERQAMQERFDKLALLLNCLLQHRFGHDFVSRGASMSQALYDSMASVALTYDEIVFQDGELRDSAPAVVQTVSSPRRFNQLWARATVDRPAGLDWIETIEARNAGSEWVTFLLEERVPLQGVDKISVELNLLCYNIGAKRPVHRR